MDQQSLPTAAPASTELEPGTLIDGRYEIVRLLGMGGMGAVYEARHKDIGRTVALKVLHPQLVREGQFAQRFLQEARTANDVRHRHIVQILDFGVERDRSYMVLEYLRGESLGAYLERVGTVTPGEIVRIMDPVLRAISFAHARGIVHRDIKPENIFLALEDDGSEPVPKVLDFGIAKRTSDAVRLTSTQMSLGTPAYMAPEQVTGARDVTGAADQYAIGVLLFEALTARLPHEGDGYNALIIAKATTPPTQLAALRPGIDPGFAAVVMRALEPAAAARFPSVEALRQALAPYARLEDAGGIADDIGEEPTMALPAPAAGFDVTNVSSPVPAVAGPSPSVSMVIKPVTLTARADSARVAGSTSPLVWLAVVAVALAAIGGAAFVLRGRAAAPSSAVVAATTTPGAVAGHQPSGDVVFRVRVTPPEAEVRLDGELLGHGQVEVRRPRNGQRYRLELSAPGYETARDVLAATADERIDRPLAPIAAPAATGAPGAPTATAPAAAAPATSATRGSRAGTRVVRGGASTDGRHPRILRSLE